MSITTGRMLSWYINWPYCWGGLLAGPISHIRVSSNIQLCGPRYQGISRCSVIPEKELNISEHLIIDRTNIEFCGDIQIVICRVLEYQLIIDCQQLKAYLQRAEWRQSESGCWVGPVATSFLASQTLVACSVIARDSCNEISPEVRQYNQDGEL